MLKNLHIFISHSALLPCPVNNTFQILSQLGDTVNALYLKTVLGLSLQIIDQVLQSLNTNSLISFLLNIPQSAVIGIITVTEFMAADLQTLASLKETGVT